MGRKRNQINDATLSTKVSFKETSIEVLNERFTTYTTSVMSYTQIANGFSFPKQVIQSKFYQLDMLPVIGYYNENKEDFEGHEEGKTVPFGAVIPNSARFEDIDGEEYLVVDVAMWSSKYPEVKDLSLQNQSMELVGISGTYNSTDKFYEVSDFSFDALCILGEDVKPAFRKARMDVDAQFSDEFEEFKQDFEQFLEDIKQKEEKKGEEKGMENEDKIIFKLSHETIREKIFSAMNPVEDGYRTFNYFVCEVKDDCFTALDCSTWEDYYRFNYSILEDGEISIDMEAKEKAFSTFMTMAEMNALDEAKAQEKQKFSEVNEQFEKLSEQFAQLTSDIEAKDAKIVELEEFKANKEQEELEKFQKEEETKIAEIKSKFSAKLSAEEIESAINAEMTSDEVNKVLSVVFAQKMLSEETPQTTQVFADISDNTPKIVTNEDRLVEEAKALRNKNIK